MTEVNISPIKLSLIGAGLLIISIIFNNFFENGLIVLSLSVAINVAGFIFLALGILREIIRLIKKGRTKAKSDFKQ